MNISTYEARIAALEAQLGPEPGPATKTGLLSVVFTPDFGGINARLAELLPMTSGVEKIEILDDTLKVGDTFSVSVTPGSDWKALAFDPGAGVIPSAGDAGETFTATFEAIESEQAGIAYMFVNCASSEEIPPSGDDYASIQIRINPR